MSKTIQAPPPGEPALPDMVRAELKRLRNERDEARAERDQANAALEHLIAKRLDAVGGWKP